MKYFWFRHFYWKYSNFCKKKFLNTNSWSWIMNVLCFVLMVLFVEINAWQVLKRTYLVLIQCSWLVEIYTWNGYFGWACINEAVNSSFRGNPCLITKLYSLKYKVSLVWCMWVVCEFHAIFKVEGSISPNFR